MDPDKSTSRPRISEESSKAAAAKPNYKGLNNSLPILFCWEFLIMIILE